MTDSTEKLNLDRCSVYRLYEVMWLLSETRRLEHHVATGPLKVDIDADLDLRVKLEVSDRFVSPEWPRVLHTLLFPLLVVFEGEGAEGTGLFEGLESV